MKLLLVRVTDQPTDQPIDQLTDWWMILMLMMDKLNDEMKNTSCLVACSCVIIDADDN